MTFIGAKIERGLFRGAKKEMTFSGAKREREREDFLKVRRRRRFVSGARSPWSCPVQCSGFFSSSQFRSISPPTKFLHTVRVYP